MSDSALLRTLVAAATPFYAELLALAIETDDRFDAPVCVTSGEEMLNVMAARPVDVAVVNVDLCLSHGDGLAAVRELLEAYPNTPILLLLDRSDRDLVVQAFRAGARGVFAQSGSIETLRKAILSVHCGQVWADSLELGYLLQVVAASAPPRIVNARGDALLSKREEEIVWLVAEGMTNRDISAELKISEHTVKNYLFRVFDKLGVSNRSELVAYALHQRLDRSEAA